MISLGSVRVTWRARVVGHSVHLGDNHHILNFGNPLKSGGGAVLGSGLALLGIMVMINVVAEDCDGLTMSNVDHPPP